MICLASSWITDPTVERYIYHLLAQREGVLARMEEEAEDRGIPIVGPLVGKILYLIGRLAGARRILEIGTAIGYSTAWLARAAKENGGKVVTLEFQRSLADEARKNLEKLELADYVDIKVGDAIEVILTLREAFDLIFIDADKEEYVELLELCVPILGENGIILADNALWGGSVAASDRSVAAVTLRKFNSMLSSDPRFDAVILPVRDGLAFALLKKGTGG